MLRAPSSAAGAERLPLRRLAGLRRQFRLLVIRPPCIRPLSAEGMADFGFGSSRR